MGSRWGWRGQPRKEGNCQMRRIEASDLTPEAREDLCRYLDYSWPFGLVARLINRFHGLTLTNVDVRHLADELRPGARDLTYTTYPH